MIAALKGKRNCLNPLLFINSKINVVASLSIQETHEKEQDEMENNQEDIIN